MLVRLPANQPLALIGDIHGELAALEALLRRLDCHPSQGRPARTLVFLGDLVDRGPDSPGVVRLVSALMDGGAAFCILGNHEANIVRGQFKPGNQWFFGPQWQVGGRRTDTFSAAKSSHPYPSRAVETDQARADMVRFFEGLPLALERDDLRVVHACWHDALTTQGVDWMTLGDRAEAEILSGLRARGLLTKEKTDRYDRATGEPSPAEAARIVQVEMATQNENPVKVAISGIEEPFDAPRWLGAKWRVLGRRKWWTEPSADTRPVVIGHYWRARAEGGRGPWSDVPPFQWAGGTRPVFCVDYSVGRRFLERARSGGDPARFHGGLAAMLWPERVLVFDDHDDVIATT